MDGSAPPPPPGAAQVQCFGNACFDAAAQLLTVNGVVVGIEQRPRELLALLLARRGDVVSKEELLNTLWLNRIVTEASLTKCVGRLRAALGDGDHRVIRTVHGQGYRLDVPVTQRARSSPVVAAPALASRGVPVPANTRPWFAVAGVFLVLVTLGLALRGPASPRHDTPPAAARAQYIKALRDVSERTPAALTRAVAEFTEALRLDGQDAPAEAGLATCYNLLPEYTAMPATQAYALAERAAQRAIALQPELAEAHAAYAFALFWGDWDFAAAKREYGRALQLAPDNPAVHHWYATSLDLLGQHGAALGQIERALELDPTSLPIRADRGLILFDGGRKAEARAVLAEVAAQAPAFLSTHHYLAEMSLSDGDDAGYVREELIYTHQHHDDAGEGVARAAQQALESGGKTAFSRSLLAARLAGYAAGTTNAADVASAYALNGDLPQATSYLNLAIDRHDQSTIYLLNDPGWQAFLGSRALQPILARLHLDRPDQP